VSIELIDVQSIAPDGIRIMKHCIRACALNKVSTDDFERVNSCMRLVAIFVLYMYTMDSNIGCTR
jgi:hypothetical protein